MALRDVKTRLLREERGWALMDAIWSSVIVVIAFSTSMAVFNSSERSAAREAKNTQAIAVAQDQLNWMRSVGQADEQKLLDLNNTSKSVAYRGTNFTVNFTAVPSAGTGEGTVEACSVDRDAAGDTDQLPDNRHYIYMRVVVSYPGQVVRAGGPTGAGPSSSQPIALDSNFAAEGGISDANSGILRVYILNRDGGVASGISNVTLLSGSTTITPTATNASKACYLFAGLSAGQYTIRVATAKQDVYLSRTAGVVQRTYQMPTGVLRSTSITVETPVSVSPIYKAFNVGTSSAVTVDPTASGGANNVNPFVKGPDNLGLWVGYSSDIIEQPNTSFFLTPGGLFRPTPASTETDKSKIFPTDLGYSAYAGPCRVNDPGNTNWVPIPTDPNSASWAPGATVTPRPELWLSELKPSAMMTAGPTSRPSGSAGWWETKTYYWNQLFQNGQVQVALVGSNAGAASPAECNAGFELGSDTAAKWRRLPGTFANGATLDDIASALPTGKYDICVRARFTYKSQNYYGGGLFGSGKGWQGSEYNGTQDGYVKLSSYIVGYQAAPQVLSASLVDLTSPNVNTLMNTGVSTSASTCGNTTGWS